MNATVETISSARANHYPDVSIIVTTLNNELTIEECLRSINELDYPQESIEVLLIDGGSKDSTLDIAKKYKVKIVCKTINAPAAYNYASRIVKNEILAFIDADAKVERQWLKKLIPNLYDKKVAAVSGTIETWNKNRLIPRCIGYDLHYRYGRISRSVQRIATMNLILRKKVINEVGGFDENFPTQYDTDIGTKIATAGYKIILDTKAKCYHYHRPTLTEYFKQQFKYGQNTLRLYLKRVHLMIGDEITDWWMNLQPVLYLSLLVLLGVSLVEALRRPASITFVLVATGIMLQYTFSAVKLSIKYHDLTALALIIIYFTRAFAWTLGGITIFISSILRRGRTK